MNYNQDSNQGSRFNDSLFGNTQTSYENDFSSSEETDVPPELGEIKNLNDATNYQAPTMDALEPANYINEKDALYDKDPLDLYEKNGYVNEKVDPILNSDLQTNKENEENSSVSASSQDVLNYEKPFDELINANPSGHFTSFFNDDKKTLNSDLQPDNETEEVESNYTSPNLEDQSSHFDNQGETSSDKSLDDEYEDNNLPKDAEDNAEINADSANQNDYEVINKSLLEDNNTDLLGQENDVSKSPDLSEISGEDVIDDSYHNEKMNADEVKKKEVTLPNSKENELTDISSLGISDAYNGDDSLEILESDDIDIQSKDPNDLVGTEDEVRMIKDLVEDLKNKGKNVKLEEFDFENMHQLIIILEK